MNQKNIRKHSKNGGEAPDKKFKNYKLSRILNLKTIPEFHQNKLGGEILVL